jgi:quercetin dioxygenase-like cupin family protein
VSGAGFTIVAADDCEQSGTWLLVRRSLGLESFGMNVVDIQPGERIPEHDETGRDQEEVFLVLSGDGATIVIDGEEHDLPTGSFARLDPQLRRTVANNGPDPVRLLIASAPLSSGYEPMGWA